MTFVAEDLLKELEGCRLTAYRDQGGIWTIGYGHTGPEVCEGMTIPQEKADALLRADIDSFCNRVQLRLRKPLTDNQFSAAVCFAYNVRGWALTPLFGLLSSGDTEKAKAHWLLYDKITMPDGSKVESEGLLNRRKKELDLFCKV